MREFNAQTNLNDYIINSMLFLKVSKIIWLVKWRISDIVQSFHKHFQK